MFLLYLTLHSPHPSVWEWVSWWWPYAPPSPSPSSPGSVSPLRGCAAAAAARLLSVWLGMSVVPAQDGGSAWPSQQTTGVTDLSTLMQGVMTERGGPSDSSTAPAGVMGISVATTVDGVDTGWPDPTVIRGSLWVRGWILSSQLKTSPAVL